ncbi:MAG: PhzF family phenazine biosynthesis protein [bacterium]
MKIPYYQLDAFAEERFKGNPAGVCFLPRTWLPDGVMQKIAAENGVSETAFVLREGEGYGLRWFSPTMEVDLCGHATLATAHAIFFETGLDAESITFTTRSGDVSVARVEDMLVLDFPARPPVRCEPPSGVEFGLGTMPQEIWRARDYLVVFETEADVTSLQPDFEKLREWDGLGVIATAPGDAVDFVSRFFAPKAGLNEDPVTGSAHATLIPYWARRLKKKELHALQISARGGELFCQDEGDRVKIGGYAVTYLRGELDIIL